MLLLSPVRDEINGNSEMTESESTNPLHIKRGESLASFFLLFEPIIVHNTDKLEMDESSS